MEEALIEVFARKSGLMEAAGAYMEAGLFDGSNLELGEAMKEFAKLVQSIDEAITKAEAAE